MPALLPHGECRGAGVESPASYFFAFGECLFSFFPWPFVLLFWGMQGAMPLPSDYMGATKWLPI